jgi:hypothetical protein
MRIGFPVRKINRHTGMTILKPGFSCDAVVTTPTSQEGELPFTGIITQDSVVWVATKLSEDRNRVSSD